jgi:cytoskeletal protein RodZ
MPETLGEKLRQAREEQGISISEVAEQTRISASYLESIENDDYRPLPGGIFNKGFVKSFAKYLGIDEQEAMQDYARISASQENADDKNISKSYRPEVLTDDSSGPSMLPTIILAIIILGLMTWGIFALVNYLEDSQSQTVENNIANNNVKNDNINSNVSNTNSASQSIPSTDEINVKVTTTAEELSITAIIDGKRETRLLNAQITEQLFEAEESLTLNYYKGSAESVELTINGKKIETPLPPPNYRKNGFEYEINMTNLKQILLDGKINLGGPAETPSPETANVNSAVAEKTPVQPRTTTTVRPRTPTPPVVKPTVANRKTPAATVKPKVTNNNTAASNANTD